MTMKQMPKPPFTSADLATVKAALNAIKEAKAYIVTAKQAGIDVAAQEAKIAEYEPQLLAIKRTYFPGEA